MFDKNSYLGQKAKFLSKILILVKNRNFCQKFLFWSKNAIFDKNLLFWSKTAIGHNSRQIVDSLL